MRGLPAGPRKPYAEEVPGCARAAGARACYYSVKLLRIWLDECAESPRSWDSLGMMVCWHRKYLLGDRHNFRTPGEFLEWAKRADVALMLPLYLYDHSGLTISTEGWRRPYNDPWDACQVGWVYVTKDVLRRERKVKRITKEILAWAEDVLREEVKTYDQYLRGEVYGFSAYEVAGGKIADLGYCGGFFGDDPEENGMADYVPRELRGPLRAAGYLDDGLVVTEAGDVLKAGPGVLRYLEGRKLLPCCLAEQCQLLQEMAEW